MRIVLAGSTFFRSGGGIATYNRELAKSLLQAGHQLYIVTAEKGVECRNQLLNWPILSGLHFTEIPHKVRQEIQVVEAMFNAICKFDPNVLISSDHIYLTSLFPCFADHRIRIGISHFYDGLLPKTTAFRPKHTDWIIVLSNAGKEFVLGLPSVVSHQVKVLYNSVEDYDIPFDNLLKIKQKDMEFKIVYPGGANRQKSPDVVCKLVKYLTDLPQPWKLIWLGSSNIYQKKLKDKFKDEILFTGLIPQQHAADYIRDAHCLLLPSRGEGCPMSMLEAMRAGTIPLVSSCPSAMRELIDHGESGYVFDRTDIPGFSRAIHDIAGSEQLRTKLCKGARRTYEKTLKKEIWFEQMIQMFNPRQDRAKGPATDIFIPQLAVRWAERQGRWYRPTIPYLRARFAYPNLNPLIKHKD
ncbi:MAG: glycosyltransferase family 4 protein [Phycisphaerae bacterium]